MPTVKIYGVADVTSSRRVPGKDDQDVRWSSPLKTVTPLSLTERLRREFGVDAWESEEDDDQGGSDLACYIIMTSSRGELSADYSN